MTKFADAVFTVPALLTPEYAEGHARTFGDAKADQRCTVCLGHGRNTVLATAPECPHCAGTGKRAWQK